MDSLEETLNGSGPDPSGIIGTDRKMSKDYSLRYIKVVKGIFHNKRDKYEVFLEIMKDFKGNRIDVPGITSRVKELFKEHPSLIWGFNSFLPHGYEIKIPEDEKRGDYKGAIHFVRKMKNCFGADGHVYRSFIDIMAMYRNDNKPAREVHQEVANLLQDHADLLQDFTNFLPLDSATAGQQRGGSMRQEKSAITPTMPATKHYHMEKNERTCDLRAEHDLSVDRPDREHEKHHRRSRKEKVRKEKRDGGDHELDEKCLEHDSRDVDNGPHKRVKTSRTSDDTAAEKMHQSGEHGENIAMYSISASSFDDKKEIKSAYSDEFYYSEKVEERLSPETYQKFLTCLHMYSKNLLDRADLMIQVREILGKYPDLMVGVDDLLDTCMNKDGFLEVIIEKKLSWNKEQLARSVNVEDKGGEKVQEKDGREKDCETDDKERERLDKGTAFVAKDASDSHHNVKSFTKGKCNGCTPTSELDLSNSKKCTTSYRLLPKDYQMLLASKKKSSVLNDVCVSVTYGSEDSSSSFKHMRKNQYEESLFRCEEDRFELDMLLESVKTTTKKVEELIEKMQNTSGEEITDLIDEHFSRQNLRCIENLYGDHGLDVIDVLHKNATVALPVILTRLKQKEKEWSSCYSEFNEVWADVYAKNYHKSLDHRSIYFKQQDSKNLSTKALLAEIKEISEEKRVEDDIILAIASVNQRPIVPDMEFEYVDTEVHEDLYQIIKHSCGQMCTSADQADQVLRVWMTFLEPMLGVPPRPPHGEDGDVVKNVLASAGESNGSPGANGEVDSSRKLNGYNGAAERVEKRHVRTNLEFTSGVSSTPKFHMSGNKIGPEPHISNNDVSSLEGGDCARTVSVNGDCTTENNEKVYRCPQSSHSHHSFEVESAEGEILRNEDLEEENFVSFEDTATDADNEDQESTQGTTEDSENASADGEECSNEDHEEEVNADHDAKAESEGEAKEVSDAHDAEGEITSLPFLERILRTAKPLAKLVPSLLHNKEDNDSHIFYGNDSFYVLFRLHQTLYQRLLSAKTNSGNANLYAKFMGSLYKLLDGSSDSTEYEDDCLAIIGSQSYVLFTLDALIRKVVKQLQAILADDMDNILDLYLYEKSRRPGRFFDIVYHENARFLLHDERLYCLEHSSNPNRLSIQLVAHAHKEPEVTAVSMNPDFTGYLYDELLSSSIDDQKIKGIFMRRNKRKFGTDDIVKAMQGTLVFNGLESKIACDSSKVSYVMETEDCLFRSKKSRLSGAGTSPCELISRDTRKVQRFHSFLKNFLT